jgi:hypothetical protein
MGKIERIRNYELEVNIAPGQWQSIRRIYNDERLAMAVHTRYARTNSAVVVEKHRRWCGIPYLRFVIQDSGECFEGLHAMKRLVEAVGLEFKVLDVKVEG